MVNHWESNLLISFWDEFKVDVIIFSHTGSLESQPISSIMTYGNFI